MHALLKFLIGFCCILFTPAIVHLTLANMTEKTKSGRIMKATASTKANTPATTAAKKPAPKPPTPAAAKPEATGDPEDETQFLKMTNEKVRTACASPHCRRRSLFSCS